MKTQGFDLHGAIFPAKTQVLELPNASFHMKTQGLELPSASFPVKTQVLEVPNSILPVKTQVFDLHDAGFLVKTQCFAILDIETFVFSYEKMLWGTKNLWHCSFLNSYITKPCVFIEIFVIFVSNFTKPCVFIEIFEIFEIFGVFEILAGRRRPRNFVGPKKKSQKSQWKHKVSLKIKTKISNI